jgi:hypothetical protein
LDEELDKLANELEQDTLPSTSTSNYFVNVLEVHTTVEPVARQPVTTEKKAIDEKALEDFLMA